MEVSIIIRTYNEARDVRRCLEAMLKQDFDRPFEIVIVYNTDSTDNTLEIVQSMGLKVVKKGHYNAGENINFGIKNSDGKYLVITSAHCYPVDSHWLSNLYRNFSDPEVAGVYGKQVIPDSAKPMARRQVSAVYNDSWRSSRDNPVISNVNCMIRRDVWEKHQYDESPGNVVEDICWGMKVQEMGYKIVYEPKAAMVHYHNDGLRGYYRRSRSEGYGLMYAGLYAHPLRSILATLVKDTLADALYLLSHPRYICWLPYAPLWRISRSFGLYAGMRAFQRDGRKPLFKASAKRLWKH